MDEVITILTRIANELQRANDFNQARYDEQQAAWQKMRDEQALAAQVREAVPSPPSEIDEMNALVLKVMRKMAGED